MGGANGVMFGAMFISLVESFVKLRMILSCLAPRTLMVKVSLAHESAL